MKTIRPTEVLAYYDGVEVFVGQDSIGGHYLGSFIDASGDADRYLVVGARPERLREHRAGALDLRSFLLESPGGEWYTTLAWGEAGESLVLEPQDGSLEATDFLPDDGFLLRYDKAGMPEGGGQPNFDAVASAGQNGCNCPVRVGIAKTVKPTAILDYYDGVLLFEAQDLLGGHYIGAAGKPKDGYARFVVTGARPERLIEFRFGTLDLRTLLLEGPGGEWYITSTNGNLGESLVLEPQEGNLADITGLLPLEGYTLGDDTPDIQETQRRIGIGKPVILTGLAETANRAAGHWELSTGDGMKSGKLAPGAGLDGLEIGKRYRFHCTEIGELDEHWRDKRVLYLRDFQKA